MWFHFFCSDFFNCFYEIQRNHIIDSDKRLRFQTGGQNRFFNSKFWGPNWANSTTECGPFIERGVICPFCSPCSSLEGVIAPWMRFLSNGRQDRLGFWTRSAWIRLITISPVWWGNCCNAWSKQAKLVGRIGKSLDSRRKEKKKNTRGRIVSRREEGALSDGSVMSCLA